MIKSYKHLNFINSHAFILIHCSLYIIYITIHFNTFNLYFTYSKIIIYYLLFIYLFIIYYLLVIIY